MSDTSSAQLLALSAALHALEHRHTREIAIITPAVADEEQAVA